MFSKQHQPETRLLTPRIYKGDSDMSAQKLMSQTQIMVMKLARGQLNSNEDKKKLHTDDYYKTL